MTTITEQKLVLQNIVKKTAKANKVENFKINLHITEQTKNGFSGEIFKASLDDIDRKKTTNIVIKIALKTKEEIMDRFIDLLFQNEIVFYKYVLPQWINYQEEKLLKDVFHPFPKCLYLPSEDSKYLVFEDITFNGFKMWDKTKTLPKDHLVIILKTYGILHGLSFAFKEDKREEYNKLINHLMDPSDSMKDFQGQMMATISATLRELQEQVEEKVANKLEKYADGTLGIGCLPYLGDYSCILHGDCWSNNMMFKYNPDHKLEKISIIDWQICRQGTPVFDLSYLFYTGAGIEAYNELDFYLKVYYDSLSSFLQKLGKDSSKVFPFEALKKDWMDYSKYGFMLATFILKLKLTNNKDTKEAFKDTDFSLDVFDTLKFDKELFYQKMIDLVMHLDKIDAL